MDPPTRRCRVWQMDFSEFETTGGGVWRLAGVVDYAAKVALACPVTTTQTATDAIASLEAARLQAEAWLDVHCSPVRQSRDGRAFPGGRRDGQWSGLQVGGVRALHRLPTELAHVRTRYRSPGTNGVIERFFQAVKYEHLYREELRDGAMVVAAVARYLDLYDAVRPHETLGQRAPLTAWHTFDEPDRQALSDRNCLSYLTRDIRISLRPPNLAS